MNNRPTDHLRWPVPPYALGLLLLCWMLGACSRSTAPPAAPCQPLSVPAAEAGSLPVVPCTDDTVCPPPLICDPEGADDEPACAVDPYGSEPDLLIEVFDRPRLPVEVSSLLGGDGLLVQWQAPTSARQVRCVVSGCPLTRALVEARIERCTIHDVLHDTSVSNSFIITPASQSPPVELRPETIVSTCSADDVSLFYTATELNLTCWAFSDTDLVAVSSVIRLAPQQLGRHRARVIADACDAEPIVPGSACVYDAPAGTLGICARQRCCTACGRDEHCTEAGSRCVPVPRAGDDRDVELPGPYAGYCTGSCLDDGDGDLPDAGFDEGEGDADPDALDGGVE